MYSLTTCTCGVEYSENVIEITLLLLLNKLLNSLLWNLLKTLKFIEELNVNKIISWNKKEIRKCLVI